MKVLNNQVNGPRNTNGAAGVKKNESAAGGVGKTKPGSPGGVDLGGSSKIDLSDRAQDAKKAFEIAKNGAPEVDEAKVAKFRNLIESGKYKVDAKAVADKMVDEHLSTSAFADED